MALTWSFVPDLAMLAQAIWASALVFSFAFESPYIDYRAHWKADIFSDPC